MPHFHWRMVVFTCAQSSGKRRTGGNPHRPQSPDHGHHSLHDPPSMVALVHQPTAGSPLVDSQPHGYHQWELRRLGRGGVLRWQCFPLIWYSVGGPLKSRHSISICLSSEWSAWPLSCSRLTWPTSQCFWSPTTHRRLPTWTSRAVFIPHLSMQRLKASIYSSSPGTSLSEPYTGLMWTMS